MCADLGVRTAGLDPAGSSPLERWTQVVGADGPLDAHFRIAPASCAFDLIYQSRGGRIGSPKARNTQYSLGLQVLIARLVGLDATLLGSAVDSGPARKLPGHERTISILGGYPVNLSKGTDSAVLRAQLMKGQVGIARAPSAASSSGNSTKRIRLRLSLDDGDLDCDSLTSRLCVPLTSDVPTSKVDPSFHGAPSDEREEVGGRSIRRSEAPDARPEGSPQARAAEAVANLTEEVRSVLRTCQPISVSERSLGSEMADPGSTLAAMAAIGAASQKLQEALSEVASLGGLASAKARIRSYLLQRIGEPVTTYELNGVAGIQASGRRVRELRDDEHLAISSGPSPGLLAGEYRLEPGVHELALAARWHKLIEIRGSGGSASDRCRTLLEGDHPEPTPREDLMLVAGPGVLSLALDEMAIEGWAITEELGSLPGTVAFRLSSRRRAASKSRRYVQERERILERDYRTCRRCGANLGSDTGTILQVHHHRDARRLSEGLDGFETLCLRCHRDAHEADGIADTSDEVLFPHRDPWRSS